MKNFAILTVATLASVALAAPVAEPVAAAVGDYGGYGDYGTYPSDYANYGERPVLLTIITERLTHTTQSSTNATPRQIQMSAAMHRLMPRPRSQRSVKAGMQASE